MPVDAGRRSSSAAPPIAAPGALHLVTAPVAAAPRNHHHLRRSWPSGALALLQLGLLPFYHRRPHLAAAQRVPPGLLVLQATPALRPLRDTIAGEAPRLPPPPPPPPPPPHRRPSQEPARPTGRAASPVARPRKQRPAAADQGYRSDAGGRIGTSTSTWISRPRSGTASSVGSTARATASWTRRSSSTRLLITCVLAKGARCVARRRGPVSVVSV